MQGMSVSNILSVAIGHRTAHLFNTDLWRSLLSQFSHPLPGSETWMIIYCYCYSVVIHFHIIIWDFIIILLWSTDYNEFIMIMMIDYPCPCGNPWQYDAVTVIIGFEQHTVIFTAWSSEVQFVVLQGSARLEVRLELYEELRARIWESHPVAIMLCTWYL